MRVQSFRYPLSGQLLARLLLAMGFGAKSWPEGRVSAGTFNAILLGKPVTFVLRDFIDEALGLLASPSGRWGIGPTTMSRAEVFELIYAALQGYDRTVSEINGSTSLVGADLRHALPILTLFAVRVGVFVGTLAGVRGEDPAELWQRTPFDPKAFCRAVKAYAEAVTPGMSVRERGDETPMRKNVFDRWCRTPPGESFKFTSLRKFAAWVAGRGGGEARQIEWHLRWLAAGARLYAEIDEYLGRDSGGKPWIDRLLATAVHHAQINHAVASGQLAAQALQNWLDPALRGDAEQDLAVRRMFAWGCGRATAIDLKDGPLLSEDEMLELRARVVEEPEVRRFVWARFGLMHALGFPAPGYYEAAVMHGFVDQYGVQHKHPGQYLKLQHDVVASMAKNAAGELDEKYIDDHLASYLKMVFEPGPGFAFMQHVQAKVAGKYTDPDDLSLVIAGALHLNAMQRQLAGDPLVQAPPQIAAGGGNPELRAQVQLLELRQNLQRWAEAGDEKKIVAEIERVIGEYPDMVEPQYWWLQYQGNRFINQDAEVLELLAKLRVMIAVNVVPPDLVPMKRFKEMIARRGRAAECLASVDRMMTMVLGRLEALEKTTDERWPIALTRHELAGRRAMMRLMHARRAELRLVGVLDDEVEIATLRRCVEAMTALHEARPEHPEPCLWLARFNAALGERKVTREWVRAAAQRGEAAGERAYELIAACAPRKPRRRQRWILRCVFKFGRRNEESERVAGAADRAVSAAADSPGP